MSLNVEGQKCPVCNGYMFNDDDIVFCPECGAPHHRECYKAVNHCGLEQYHGTSAQYNREKFEASNTEAIEKQPESEQNKINDSTVKCGMCNNEYDSSLRNCPECGAPNMSRLGGRYVQFDFLGGVSAQADIGEGVTADEAKKFVLSNTHRYIPKFAEMAKGRNASWNLLAFFFPTAWAFSRKMYRLGALCATAEIVLNLLMMPFSMELGQVAQNTDAVRSYAEYSNRLVQSIMEAAGGSGALIFFAAFIAASGIIALRVLLGIFGDKLYYSHTVSKIKEIKETSDDAEYEMRSKGGVSILWFFIGWIAVQVLPNIIFQFLL